MGSGAAGGDHLGLFSTGSQSETTAAGPWLQALTLLLPSLWPSDSALHAELLPWDFPALSFFLPIDAEAGWANMLTYAL